MTPWRTAMQLRAAGGMGTDVLIPFKAELSAGDKMTVRWLARRKTNRSCNWNIWWQKSTHLLLQGAYNWVSKVGRIVYRTATVWQNQRFLPSENIHAASDTLLCAPDIHSLKTRGEWVPTRHQESCTLCSKRAESPQPCQMGGHHQLQGKAPTTGHRVAAQPTEPSLSLCSSICLHFRLLFGKFFIQFASLTARILSSLWL